MKSNQKMGMFEWEIDDIKKSLPFFEGVNTIGRKKTKCNLLIEHLGLSKQHAVLTCKNTKLTLKDCSSKNGTFINSVTEKIDPEKEYEINPIVDMIYISDIKCKIIPDWPLDKPPSHKSQSVQENEKAEKKEKIKSNLTEINEESEENALMEPKKINKEKNQIEGKKSKKEKKKKKQNEQKRSESNDTLVKKKNVKKRAKSEEKQEIAEMNNYPIIERKKKPIISDLDDGYRTRNLKKRCLLSGYKLSFSPSGRIQVIQDYQDHYDFLLMEEFKRTWKVLYSICRGKPILSSTWLLQSEYRKKIQPEEKYYIKCPEEEILIESVAKVKAGFRVFEDIRFFIANTTRFHLSDMEIVELIEAGGGKVTIDRAKDNLKGVNFLLPNDYDETELKEVQKLGGKKNIFKLELILDACMHQTINWDDHRIKA